MYDRVDDDGPSFPLHALRPGVIARAVQAIERDHQKRIGLIPPKPRRRRRRDDDGRLERLHGAYRRAAVELEELRRLKATGVQYAALDFNPALLHNGSAPTTSEEGRHGEERQDQ